MLAGEAKALHTTKRSSGIDVSDPELAQAWASVRQDSDPQMNWCAFTYAEVRKNLMLMCNMRERARAQSKDRHCTGHGCMITRDLLMMNDLIVPRLDANVFMYCSMLLHGIDVPVPFPASTSSCVSGAP